MSDDAKALTTAVVEEWRAIIGRLWYSSIDQLKLEVMAKVDQILATTRALETAQTALTIATSRAAEEDARSDRLQRELDDALHTFRCVEETEQYLNVLARAEKAEKERDAAVARRDEVIADLDRIQGQAGPELARLRARVASLETAFLDACREKVVHGHTTTLLAVARRLEVPGVGELCIDADRIRSEAKTVVTELVDASERLLEYYADGLPDHLVDEFRAALALAKAKGGGS